MAFSHLDASETFPENGEGRAVLISDGMTVAGVGVWVDMGVTGILVTVGLVVRGTRVAGLTVTGLYAGNGELEAKGVVAQSKGLLGFGSGAMSLGSQLILGLRPDMLAKRGWSYS